MSETSRFPVFGLVFYLSDRLLESENRTFAAKLSPLPAHPFAVNDYLSATGIAGLVHSDDGGVVHTITIRTKDDMAKR